MLKVKMGVLKVKEWVLKVNRAKNFLKISADFPLS